MRVSVVFMILALVLIPSSYGDENNATLSNNPGAKSAVNSVTDQTPVPQIRVIAYYSPKALLASPLARRRHALAKSAIDRVNLPVKKGGMGVPAEFKNVEETDSWTDLVSNCEEGEAEATSYLPQIRRGTVVVVITDSEDKEWFYGPITLNDVMDEYAQIVFMRSENERQNPNRCGLTVQATKPAPVPVPMPTTALPTNGQSVVATAAAGTKN